MASLGCTVLDLIKSDISKLVAMSSKLEDEAFSICSSRADVPEENHPAMVLGMPQLARTEQLQTIPQTKEIEVVKLVWKSRRMAEGYDQSSQDNRPQTWRWKVVLISMLFLLIKTTTAGRTACALEEWNS